VPFDTGAGHEIPEIQAIAGPSPKACPSRNAVRTIRWRLVSLAIVTASALAIIAIPGYLAAGVPPAVALQD
jgi:hypothetical protein